MKKISLLYLLSGISFASAVLATPMDIYLVQKDATQNVSYQLIGFSDKEVLTGTIGDMPLMGICLEGNECKRTYSLEEQFNRIYARMNGWHEVPDQFRIRTGVWPVTVTSQINRGSDFIEVVAESNLMGSKTNKSYALTDISLQVDFAKTNPGPRRMDYLQVSDNLKDLSQGVFQIFLKIEDDGLSSNGESSGTGFFINHQGYAMTNLHVAEGLKQCMKEKSCEIQIAFKDIVSRTETVNADLMTCSAQLDFCLFKFDFPVNKYFEIETKTIPKDLLTLGYPGDKRTTFDGRAGKETALTYAIGSPIGFFGLGVSTSLFIAGGASGSPVLDDKGEKVVGILSNGATSFGSPDGAPGIFRPMALIESIYQISQYLDETKQTRVDAIIHALNMTEDTDVANEMIKSYGNEKTYYSFNQLEILSYAHPTKAIRKQLFLFLKNFNTNF
jgi:hypothetical protein